MAKGDHTRSERRGDEQMTQSQSYLTGLQSQLAGQYGGLSNNYFGGTPSPINNTFGFGSTVPHYSHTGAPYFQGNGTDIPSVPRNVGSGRTQNAQDYSSILPYLQSLGPADSATLERALPELQRRYPGLQRDNSHGPLDEIVLPDGTIVDLISNAESAGPKSWTWQAGASGLQPSGGGGYGVSGGFGGLASGAVGRNLADYNNIISRYSNFADTGGFSEADKANIRSRAVSPIRSIYSNARQGLDRQRALQGGYSPGYATAMSRFGREQGQLTSDAATNAEAAIAEMVQRGKLAGMGGMLSAYGATPGLSNMFGQQMLSGMGQQLQAAGLQNQLSLGLMNNQNQIGQIPGNYQNILGNIAGTIGLAGNVGGILYPWLGGGGAGGAGTSASGAGWDI